MATKQGAKQKLIDRINTLVGTATTVDDVNFLAKALNQIGKNPEYKDTSRTSRANVTLMDQATDTTTINTNMHNGPHREREIVQTGYLADHVAPSNEYSPSEKVNFQIESPKEARVEFGVWSAHSDYTGGGITYDQYLRPYERRAYKCQTNCWQVGGDGGNSTGTYATHQKHQQGTHANNCFLHCGTRACSSNTETGSHAYHYQRTDLVGEYGHSRIKMGAAGAEMCRMWDFGQKTRYENIEIGTGMLDHRHAYIKMAGKIIALREKWMPSEYTTTTNNQGFQSRESYESPSKMDVTYGYDASQNQLQTFQPGYGTVSYNKNRQELVHFNQITDGSNLMIGKIYRHVDRIKRLSLLNEICKPENAIYFTFTYGSGFSSSGSDSLESQKCAKITSVDDGSIFSTMLDIPGQILGLGRIKNDYLTSTAGHIQELVITNAGSGYTQAPTITISAPNTSGTTATGTLTISNGRVTGYAITNKGANYSLAKEDGYGHPTVTVDNTGAGGTGCTIVANVSVPATFESVSTKPTHSTLYGRGTGHFGQRIVMSRDRTKTVHFCPYYGMGCGMVSFIIDRTYSSWGEGYTDTDTGDGKQVMAFREDQFLYCSTQNWDDYNSHTAYLYYQDTSKSTVDASAQNKTTSWKEDNVGRQLDLMAHTTTYPAFVPYF